MDVVLRCRISAFRRGLEECVLLQPRAVTAATGWDEKTVSAKGDIVRARLTVKTHRLQAIFY